MNELDLRSLLAEHARRHAIPGAALGILRDGAVDRTFLVDAGDPDPPTVTFGAFDDTGRPGIVYEMLWGLPRVNAGGG